MEESQDSGRNGNFLSPGVGQDLASPNRSAPLAPPPGPLPAGALRTKEAPALGPPHARGSAPGRGPRLPAPLGAGSPGSTCALGRGKNPARPGRGCPRSHSLGRKRRPSRPARNEWAALRHHPGSSLEAPGENRCGRRGRLPGPPARGAASRFPFPIRPRPAPPGPRPAPDAQPPPAHPSSWRCAPGTLRWSGCR